MNRKATSMREEPNCTRMAGSIHRLQIARQHVTGEGGGEPQC
jgi:hypothetical protein